MNTLKIRYRYKDKETGIVSTFIKSMEELEYVSGRVEAIYQQRLFNRHKEIVARELFTRYQDNRGTDIYEGDILLHSKRKDICVLISNIKDAWNLFTDSHSNKESNEDWEIIGNTTDNPEFLKSEHVFVTAKTCACNSGMCPVCDGGLSICIRCGGAEGSLPTNCPGKTMGYEIEQQVYNKEQDYINGKWVRR